MGYWSRLIDILKDSKSPIDDGYEQFESASKMWKAILRASELKFDNKEEFDKARKEQLYLRRLVDKSENVNGSLAINCDSYQELPNITQESLNSFFLSENHVSDAQHMGVLAIDVNITANEQNLYKDFGQSISKNQQLSWKDILNVASHNCNSMLMFDNYLLKKKDQNLYKILEILLPQKLDESITFDLCIFTLDAVNLNTEYQSIKEKIASIRPQLNVNLSVFQCGKNDFHDRAIITNYMWIGCGGGFDLLKPDKRGFHEESEKTTTIPMIYPDLQDSTDWATQAFDLFISDAKEIKKSHRCIGSGHNRLLG